jgi:hypothetical protein
MTPKWSSLYPHYLGLPMHPDGDFFSCAIRLSMSLHQASAFNKTAYKRAGNKVSSHGWAMGAEQFYQWLRRHELGAAQMIPINGAPTFPTDNGIVYLRNCFARTTDRSADHASGDHIDLYVAGQGLLSAIRWPAEFPGGPFALLSSCRDGNIRFWPAT